MLDISLTFLVSKPDIFKYLIDEQPENNSFVLLTFEVTKLFKSKVINDLHSLNICSIYTTLVTSKVDRFNDLRFIQFWNIDFILVAWLGLKLDKSTDSNEVQ